MPLRDSLFVPFRAVCAPGLHACACVAVRGFCHVLPQAFSSRAGCRRPVSVRVCCGVWGHVPCPFGPFLGSRLSCGSLFALTKNKCFDLSQKNSFLMQKTKENACVFAHNALSLLRVRENTFS